MNLPISEIVQRHGAPTTAITLTELDLRIRAMNAEYGKNWHRYVNPEPKKRTTKPKRKTKK